MTLGERLAMLRKNAGMTQQQLGKALSISPQAVSKWEHDLAEPDLRTLKELSALYGIGIGELLGDECAAADAAPAKEEDEPQEEKKLIAPQLVVFNDLPFAAVRVVCAFVADTVRRICEHKVGQRSFHQAVDVRLAGAVAAHNAVLPANPYIAAAAFDGFGQRRGVVELFNINGFRCFLKVVEGFVEFVKRPAGFLDVGAELQKPVHLRLQVFPVPFRHFGRFVVKNLVLDALGLG